MILKMIQYYSNGNKAQFAALLGITPQGLSTWIKRDTYDIELVFSKCENISAEWLLTGEGEMLKSSVDNPHKDSDSVNPTTFLAKAPKDPAATDGLSSEMSAYIQALLDRLAQQSELIGRLRAQIEQLNARIEEASFRGSSASDAQSDTSANAV